MRSFRKELKFFCTAGELAAIENGIKTVMKRDEHQTGDHYHIRSVYFDSPFNTCFHQNEAGIGNRHKYRIRIYNKSDQLIHAEIKTKYRETISKAAIRLTREQYEAMMRCENLSLLAAGGGGSQEILDRYLAVLAGEAYRPASIVEYERTAYIYQPCNVRITFDKNIAASNRFERFFEPDTYAVPLLENGLHVLEVKYDEFLPDFLSGLLRVKALKIASCSKYYLSRMKLGRIYV